MAEQRRGEDRRDQQDHHHAQVLHHRDHPVVGAEITCDRHDSGGPAGDHPEHGGRLHQARQPRQPSPAANVRASVQIVITSTGSQAPPIPDSVLALT